MPTQQKRKSGGARKHGRNAKRCDVYCLEGRREKNKLARLKRHLSRKAKEIARKLKRGRIIKPDLQAERALKLGFLARRKKRMV